MNSAGSPSQMCAKRSAALSSSPVATAVHARREGVATIVGLFVAVGLGLTVAGYSSSIVIALGAGTVLLIIFIQARRIRMETWQVITLICLTGYVVLNYGFENLSVPLGPLRVLPVGELLMVAALIVAASSCKGSLLREALKSPPILCILALLLLTVFHLVVDVPDHGLYALRDSTFAFEALFLLLGILWTAQERNIALLAKWLMFLFIVTAIYSYTFPWAERLQAWSLISGPFHSVPLVGNYQTVAIYLLSGALFCIWVAPSLVSWPHWVLRALAIIQLAGLGILQSRAMYTGIALIFVILFLLRQRKRISQFLSTLAWAFGLLVVTILVLSAIGWKVQGRLGPMNLSSLTREVESIWPSSAESAELGHESDRRAWYGEVWNKVGPSPSRLVAGVGFGDPLIDFLSDTGQPIRQPHNSSLNVLGRLGFLGLSIWLLFLSLVVRRLWNAAHEARMIAGVSCPLHLWLLAFAVLGLLDSLVQPYFEFSHSSVPFFFLVGVALGTDLRESAERAPLALSRVNFSLRAAERDHLRTFPW